MVSDRVFKKFRLLFGIFMLLLVLSASVANAEKDIVKLIKDDTTITAIGENGTNIWVKNINNKITTYVLADLDSDGKNEVVLGTDYNANKPGFVIMLETNGTTIWEYKTGSTMIFGQNRPDISDTFTVTKIIVEDLNNDSEKDVLVYSHNVPWYPARLVLLDRSGIQIGEYWHPGYIIDVKVADINGDGHKEVIAGGINNDLDYSPVFFVLDPQNMRGQAPPYMGNAPNGPYKFYEIIDKSEVQPIASSVTEISIKGDILVVTVGDGRFLNYDIKNMELLNTAYSDFYIREKQKLGKEKLEKFFYSQLSLLVTILGLVVGIVGLIKWEFIKKWSISNKIESIKKEIEVLSGIVNICEAKAKLAEAEKVLKEGDYKLAEEAIGLVKAADVGSVYIRDLINFNKEFDNKTIEIEGTINGIKSATKGYIFTMDDDTGKISVCYRAGLSNIMDENKVQIKGVFKKKSNFLFAKSIKKIENT